jgi:gamma-glutamyltranspeptidase/glutathione hydrolase
MKNPCLSKAHTSTLFLAVALVGCLSPTFSASRPPVKAKHGMVVSGDSLASAAGLAILRRGGNAVDAAVACGFALAVTYPEAGNIGGGGFMVIRLADGRTTMIDFREMAPGRSSRGMYLDGAGKPVPERSLVGPLASGVPGSVAGFLLALEKYGTLTRSEVLAPAVRLAEEGYPVGERLSASLVEEWAALSRFPASLNLFSHHGEPLRPGDTLRQSDLARTLQLITLHGTDGFYSGRVAESIVAEMRRHGGIIDEHDLSRYRAIERPPLKGTYRGYEVITSSPPSGGGTALLEILNFLERFDLKAMGWNSSRAIHVLASASQRAFADRAAYMGDPDFGPVPLDILLSKTYAADRTRGWDSLQATSSSAIPAGELKEHRETTHFSVADRWGNVVSTTVTLNELFGCKAIVDGGGFFLNDEMDDFSVKPGATNVYGLVGGEPNAIAPGKRMLSSMTPTIVLKEGKPFLSVGARGGGRITTTVAQIISNVVDYGMNMQEAVDAPRVHHQWEPDTLLYERQGLVADVLHALGSMHYHLKEIPWTARAEALMIDPATGTIFGGPDPREEGFALGY